MGVGLGVGASVCFHRTVLVESARTHHYMYENVPTLSWRWIWCVGITYLRQPTALFIYVYNFIFSTDT
jgi:hypothetical protein